MLYIFSITSSLLVAVAADAVTLHVHGSTTVAVSLFAAHKAELERKIDAQLDVVDNGSSKGLIDVAKGIADIGMISAPFEAMAEFVEHDGTRTSGLEPHQIGQTCLGFIVHPSNPVTALSFEQIKAILAGRITRWSEVGGADLHIVIVMPQKGDGVREIVERELMHGAPISDKAKDVPNPPVVKELVSRAPSAFGILAHPLVDASIKEVRTTWTMAQPLILVTNGPPTPVEEKLIAAAREMLH